MMFKAHIIIPALVLSGCNPALRCPYGSCSTDTSDSVKVTTSELIEGSTVTCEDPSHRQNGPFDVKRATTIASRSIGVVGGGVLVADFDGNGSKDVFVLGAETPSLWAQTDDGGFVEVSNASLPQWGVGFTNLTGGSIVDIDADGDFDVYLTVWNDSNHLWINDGNGVFTQASDEWSGFDGGSHRTMSSAWGDMDGDDDLDLVLGGFGPHPADKDAPASSFEVGDPVILLENLGDGSFQDVSDRLPPSIHDGYQTSVVWLDLDDDSRPDLIVSNNYGWVRPGDVIWNTSEGFSLDGGASGFSGEQAVFGIGLGDINHDGAPDFVRSGFRESSVLKSSSAVWRETAEQDGIQPDDGQAFGWGVVVEDFNNDTLLDVMMVFGYWDQYSNSENQANALFVQEQDGLFADRASAWVCDDDGYGRGLVATDLNGDGWMDTVEQRLDDEALMQISRCGQQTWLKVALEDEGPNRNAIGAKVEVSVGDVTQTRWITAGGFSAFSDSSPEAHFGLGNAAVVDTLTVTWPDGDVATFSDVASRQYATIRRSWSTE